MPLFHLLLLAVIQGIAEFLPISSTGHLVVVASLLSNHEDIVDVNIMLHLGTLVAIVIFYFRRVLRLISEDRRVILLLIVGTLPAAVLGLTIKRKFEWLLESPMLTGCMLIVTGLILLIPRALRDGSRQYQQLTLAQAFGIGCAQAVALLPGISRSGSTIVAGLGTGLTRLDAAAFSFLLAIPAIAGASLLECIDLWQGSATLSTPPWQLGVAAAVACVVGLAALNGLIRTLERGQLYLFTWWCLGVGLLTIIWQLAGGQPLSLAGPS